MPTKRLIVLIIHWVIIINFILEIFYGGYKTFTLNPAGEAMVLFDQAKDLPYEMMVTRRLYAIETWIAIAGLSIYLALTEFRRFFPAASQERT